MKFRVLFMWLTLGLLLQLVSFSCYCPEYYEIAIFDDNPTIDFLTYDDVEYHSWIYAQKEAGGDSLKILFKCPLRWTDTTYSFGNTLVNSCYASSPCDPIDFLLGDSIIDIRLLTLDTLGSYFPNEEIIGIKGWEPEKKVSVITEFNSQSGYNYEGILIDCKLDPRSHKGNLKFKIEIDLLDGRSIKSESKEFFWY